MASPKPNSKDHTLQQLAQMLQADSIAPGLSGQLAARLHATLSSFAQELREELPAWENALAALDPLSDSPLLGNSKVLDALRDELESHRSQALVLLDLLGNPNSNTPARLPTSEPPLTFAPIFPISEKTPPSPPRAETQSANLVQPSNQEPLPRIIPIHEATISESTEREIEPPQVIAAKMLNRKLAEDTSALKVVCPDCGAKGVVRWDRLQNILSCKSCSRYYHVGPDGKMTAMSRTAQGAWIKTKTLADQRSLRFLRSRLVLSIASIALIFLSICIIPLLQSPAGLPSDELPKELEPRAERFSKAWLERDLPMMRQLTLSTHERGVYSWLLKHEPPLRRKVDPVEWSDIRYEVLQKPRLDQRVDVVVRIHHVEASKSKRGLELKQCWEEREGIWFFIPTP